MKKRNVLKPIILMVSIAVLLSSCDKKTNNGAKVYSGDNNKVSEVGFYSEKNTIPDDVFFLNSMQISSDKLYCTSLVNKLDKTLCIQNKEDNTVSHVSFSEENLYIYDAILLGEDIYISFDDGNGKKTLANIDSDGNILRRINCDDSVNIVKWSEDSFANVYIKEFSELYTELFVTLYDKNISKKETINLSEKLCNDGELLVSLFVDESGNLWTRKVYDLKSEEDYKIKIVKYNRDTFEELLTIDYSEQIGNIQEMTAGKFLWVVSDDEDEDNDIKYINKHDITTGKVIDMYELEEASNITESDEYDFVYTYNQDVYGYKDDKKTLISSHKPYSINKYREYNKYALTVGYSNKSLFSVIEKNTYNDDFLRYDIEIPLNSYVNEVFSIKDGKICFNIYDTPEYKNAIVWYDIEKNETKFCPIDMLSENTITGIEIINSEQIYIVLKTDSGYKNILYNIQTGDITDKEKSEYIELFRTSSNDIAMITYDEEKKYCLYNADENGEFNFLNKLEMDFSYEEIDICNGFEDCMFFIRTPEGISEYSNAEKKLNYIISNSDLVTGCSADKVVPLNSQHCLVYGLNHMSYEFELMSVKSRNDTERKTLSVALIGQPDAQIDNAISYFNKNNPEVKVVKSTLENSIEKRSDIFIYDDSFNDNAYTDNLLFCDIREYISDDINSDEYFSFVFQGDGSGFKVVPSFSICDYKTGFDADEFTPDEEQLIEKFILYRLGNYKEDDMFDFHNEDFYDTLIMLKNRESVDMTECFAVYKNYSDFNEETVLSDKAVIVPQYYVSVMDTEKKEYAAEFIKYLLSDECQTLKTGDRSEGMPVKKTKFSECIKKGEMPENQLKLLEDKIDQANCILYDKNVFEIVYNEIVDYLGGRIDEKLVADNIESKLRLNFSERE